MIYEEDFRIVLAGNCNSMMRVIPLEDFTSLIRDSREGKVRNPIKRCIDCGCIIPKHNETGYCRFCYRTNKNLTATRKEWDNFWKREYLNIAEEEINNYNRRLFRNIRR